MALLSSKQQEMQLREESIINTARDLLMASGYHGLTMDRIADAMEYSKGTIYQHFHCKEEVISAIARRALEAQARMQEQGATWPGCSRERMVAVGEAARLYFLLHPQDIHLVQIIQTQAIQEKASEEMLAAMQALELRSQRLMTDIVRGAVSCGDVTLPENCYPEELAFGLWSITHGAQALYLRDIPLKEIRIDDFFSSILKVCDILGDGYGWKPLSTEQDYSVVRQKIRERLFPEELAQLESRS